MSNLTNNTAALQDILDAVNALPKAGSDVTAESIQAALGYTPADQAEVDALSAEVSSAEGNPLLGKKIVYDGDSICESRTGSYANNGGSYPKLISEITKSGYENQGVSGARLITKGESGSFHSIVDNVTNLSLDGDIYCFEGGINDYYFNSPLGDFFETEYSSEFDTTTVCGALETIFNYALNHFVGKAICFIIVHKVASTAYAPNTAGNTFSEYREKIVGICRKYSIPYYDAFAESGLNGWNNTQNTAFLDAGDSGLPDGIHPNKEGYLRYYVPQLIALFKRIVPRVEKTEFSVTNDLTFVTTNNSVNSVAKGASYQAILTINEGYVLDEIVITVGYVDVTASVYNNGVISIPNVYGDISITAAAKIQGASYTNLVPGAVDTDGVTVFNNPYGYMNDKIQNWSNGIADAVGYLVTGFIKFPEGRIPIYIKGADWVDGDNKCRNGIYSVPGNSPANMGTGDTQIAGLSLEKLGDKYYKMTPTQDFGAYWYRFSLLGTIDASTGEELIITHGEPIE